MRRVLILLAVLALTGCAEGEAVRRVVSAVRGVLRPKPAPACEGGSWRDASGDCVYVGPGT